VSQAKAATPPVCMGCQSHIASPLFCFSCNSLQRLSSPINYFEALALPYSYNLNLEVLEQHYQKLVAELHPDFYLASSSFEKTQSERSSSLLNLAYTTLKNPSTRASYLLKLISRGSSEGSENAAAASSNALPEGFLEEIFDFQESLADWKETEDSESLESFSAQISERIEDLYAQYAIIFNEMEENRSQLCSKQLLQLKIHLNTEKYLQRLLEQCPAKSTEHRAPTN